MKARNAAVMLYLFLLAIMTKINIKPCYLLVENDEDSFSDALMYKLSMTFVSVSATRPFSFLNKKFSCLSTHYGIDLFTACKV